ncbi:MAG: class I SAM-dependent methyltransferase [Pyrobaculum sp.]
MKSGLYISYDVKRVENISYDVKRVKSDLERGVGATRLLFLPLFHRPITCEALSDLTNGRAVNYKTDDYLIVVEGGIGPITQYKIPCVLDIKRMPPLKRYIEAGFLTKDFKRGPNYAVIEFYYRVVATVYRAMKWCSGDIHTFSNCVGVPEGEVKKAIGILRTLYPSLLEISYGNIFFRDKLGNKGRLIRRDDYWSDLYYFIENGVITTSKKPERYVVRLVRSHAARYSIPPILDKVDFRDAVVSDIGSGFGTKGAYGIRRGARYVLLIDIDEKILRQRGSGLLVDRIVADAHFLPLRNKSVDVVILWNVLQFLSDEIKALSEVKRIVRREVVLSVYNAVSGLRRYSYNDFIERAVNLGRLKVLRRYGNNQFQAIVRYAH